MSSRSSLREREKNRKPPTEITIKEGDGPEDRPMFGTRERRRESERGESRRKTYDEGLKNAPQKGAVAAAAPPGATLGAQRTASWCTICLTAPPAPAVVQRTPLPPAALPAGVAPPGIWLGGRGDKGGAARAPARPKCVIHGHC